MENRLIEIKELRVSFYYEKGRIQVVRGFDLELNKGEIVGILGESGSGKTVSVSSIIRLIDESVGIIDSGEVIYNGRNLLKSSEKELNEIRGNKISYIFQNSSAALSPYKTIGKQMTEVLRTHKLPYTRELILNSLYEVGIEMAETVYGMYPFQLSGGQNQRIMIAQSILCKPELLIADEPTSSIDASLQKTILDILRNISEKNNTSVIIITHNFGVAKYLCDRLIVMYGGLVVEEGSITQILEAPFHPYTQELIKCVSSLDEDGEIMYTIEGAPPTPFEFKDECPFYSRCKFRESACAGNIPELKKINGRKARCILFGREVIGS
jgi:peptide/nickel transport system ATP-binding protein